ncbi:MAG: SRPBCC family protein [Lewinellaceae bacterium]|nr:SRPBCC family protein [Lewinellaceae bacterium]
MRHRLIFNQTLRCELDTAWLFFTNPYNLSKITPDDMRFEIKNKELPKSITKGLKIDYIVSPLWNIPLKWKTEITDVQHQELFADMQLVGPFKYWLHTHTFEPCAEGVSMTDVIEYELPLGWIGEIAHTMFVKRRLNAIFTFRRKILDHTFNNA